MPRIKLISDDQIFRSICHLLIIGGDKAVSFASVARATGLAQATLAQRFGTRDGMVFAALEAEWTQLYVRVLTAGQAAPQSTKGALTFLKALDGDAPDGAILAATSRDARLREKAIVWRNAVESGLAERLGGGPKAQDAASGLFVVWQGQHVWTKAGGNRSKLKDLVKRFTD